MWRGGPLAAALQGMCGLKFIQRWFASIIDLPTFGIQCRGVGGWEGSWGGGSGSQNNVCSCAICCVLISDECACVMQTEKSTKLSVGRGRGAGFILWACDEAEESDGGKRLWKIRRDRLLAVGQVCNCPRSPRPPQCLCNVLQLWLKFDD